MVPRGIGRTNVDDKKRFEAKPGELARCVRVRIWQRPQQRILLGRMYWSRSYAPRWQVEKRKRELDFLFARSSKNDGLGSAKAPRAVRQAQLVGLDETIERKL
jgi:hypothetical protein